MKSVPVLLTALLSVASSPLFAGPPAKPNLLFLITDQQTILSLIHI